MNNLFDFNRPEYTFRQLAYVFGNLKKSLECFEDQLVAHGYTIKPGQLKWVKE